MDEGKIKVKQAWFTIIRIRIREHPTASFFLNLLFLLPIPVVIFKLMISLIPSKVFNQAPISKKDIKKIIGARGILVDVKAKTGERVYIRNI